MEFQDLQIACDEEIEEEDDKGKVTKEMKPVSNEVNIPKIMEYIERDGVQFTYAIEEKVEEEKDDSGARERDAAKSKEEKARLKKSRPPERPRKKKRPNNCKLSWIWKSKNSISNPSHSGNIWPTT